MSIPPILASMTGVDNATTANFSAQVDKLGAVINDATASTQDKLAAWNSLNGLNAGGAMYASGAKDAMTKWYDLTTDSDFAKQIQSVADSFSSQMNSVGRSLQGNPDAPAPNLAQTTLNTINKFSPDDQLLLAVSFGWGDPDSYKASLQQQSDAYEAQQAKPSVQVTLSDDAKASLAQTQASSSAGSQDTSKTAAQEALTALSASGPADAKSQAALSTLQNAAKAQEAWEKEATKDQAANSSGTPSPSPKSTKPNWPYAAGNGVDTLV